MTRLSPSGSIGCAKRTVSLRVRRHRLRVTRPAGLPLTSSVTVERARAGVWKPRTLTTMSGAAAANRRDRPVGLGGAARRGPTGCSCTQIVRSGDAGGIRSAKRVGVPLA